MPSRTDRIICLKSIPPPGGYVFPLPLNDLDDVFKIGSNYQRRWFASEITVPTGILAWIDRDLMRPFAEELAAAVSVAGYPATMDIINNRYVINGRDLEEPPVCVGMPSCAPLSLDALVAGIQQALRRGLENDAVYWLEFLQVNAPGPLAKALRSAPRLRDVIR